MSKNKKKERKFRPVYEGKYIEFPRIVTIALQNKVKVKEGDNYKDIVLLLQDKGVDIQIEYEDEHCECGTKLVKKNGKPKCPKCSNTRS